MEANTRQERELATLESKIDFLVKNSDETKADIKDLVNKVAFQNGRVTSNEKAINSLAEAIEKLATSDDKNSTWRKGIIMAGGALATLIAVLTPVLINLAVSKAQSDVKQIVKEELEMSLEKSVDQALKDYQFELIE